MKKIIKIFMLLICLLPINVHALDLEVQEKQNENQDQQLIENDFFKKEAIKKEEEKKQEENKNYNYVKENAFTNNFQTEQQNDVQKELFKTSIQATNSLDYKEENKMNMTMLIIGILILFILFNIYFIWKGRHENINKRKK